MGNLRFFVFTLLMPLLLGAVLVLGGRHGNVPCKNCKHKTAPNSQRLIASPINLLNPDRYEFFTLDDRGKVVKRIMTFKEIQSIVAGSDITELKLFANKNNNDRIVSSVVSNVRNVLNNELSLMNGHEHVEPAELPISDVIGATAVHEPFATASMHDVLHKFSEGLAGATSERITSSLATDPVTTPTTPFASPPTERPVTRVSPKTTQKPAVSTSQQKRTTATTTIRSMTVSSTEPAPVRSTYKPTETTQTQRTTTGRPTEKSTTERTIVRSTPRSTTTKTTEQPMTAVRTTPRTTTTSTTEPTVSSWKHSTDQRSTTTEMAVVSLMEQSTIAVRSTESPPMVKSSQQASTTKEPPTEPPMFKQAGSSTTAARSTEAPTVRVPEVSSTAASTTSTTTTEIPVIKTTARPLQSGASTVKPSTQTLEHSTQRSEEVSEATHDVQHATKQSVVQASYDDSNETTTSSEETSSNESAEASTTKLIEIVTQTTGSPIATVKLTATQATEQSSPSTVSTVTNSLAPAPQVSSLSDSAQVDLEPSKDFVANDVENDESPEGLTISGELSTPYADPLIQAVTSHEKTEDTFITTEDMLFDSPTPTALSVEADSATLDDSTSGNSEEQAVDEMQLTTNVYSEEFTTVADRGGELLQTDADQSTVQDTSTIPSDAQHAIHKIIESLQSLGDNSGSVESEEEEDVGSQESPYTVNIPGMNYDVDAQSSINAIIQSLGQDTLGGADSAVFTVTTDHTAAASSEEEEPNRTADIGPPQSSTIAHPTTQTSATVKRTTSAPTPTPETSSADPTVALPQVETTSAEAEPSNNFNYNANIIDTIEKFLSTFSGLPKDAAASQQSANLTEFNILSEYPAEINMTDYVDRTATVASVIKFPLSSSPEELDRTDVTDASEDTTAAVSVSVSDVDTEPILSETVASFMKLGEMLTMDAAISSTAVTMAAGQLELKTAIDEEETELLRLLSICSNLGTNVYDHLTADRSMRGRNLVYSPFATVTTLSMLFLGTRGTTAESINGVIGLDEMTSFNPHLFFKSVAHDLKPQHRRTHDRNEGGSGLDWESSFRRTLLSDESRGGLQRFFKARIQEIYSTVAETVDFRQKDMLLKHMSGDFPREYVDTLKQLRSPLVSISRNRYRHECNDATGYETMDFKPAGARSGSIVVPSVAFRSGFSTGFSTKLNATILALPGSTSNVSLFLLKPSDASAIAELEAQLHNQSISNVLKQFPGETVRTAYAEVRLPYFTQTTMYNMTQSIKQLGLQNLFDPTVANFNGLQDSSTSNLFLSEIIQTDSFALCGSDDVVARILPFRSYSTNLVKPQGEHHLARQTRSASMINPSHRNRRKLLYRNRSASTGPSQRTDSVLEFDTPFLYLVRHNPTGMILYMGRFVGKLNE